MKQILVATHNPGKVAEYAQLLALSQLEWLSLADLGIEMEVEETGTTFEQNALLKAKAYAAHSRLLTLADDSGLQVDALNGEPGIFSARYGGVQGSAQHRFLLDKLLDVPAAERTARFYCVVALCTPAGDTYTADGVLHGSITFEPRGTFGFGYDPLFYLPEYDATLAQLGPEIKNQISHRARALQNIQPVLTRLISEQ